MKKCSIDELINRYVKVIEHQNPGRPKTSVAGKQFLKSKWIEKQADLLILVKKLENKIVQEKNLTNRFRTQEVSFQIGVDVVGQPLYFTHEMLIEKGKELKYHPKISNEKVLKTRQEQHR
jgi:hypothetical protein